MSQAMAEAIQTTPSFNLDELAGMIRRIVREEVADLLDERGIYAESTIIEPGSPLYEDLVELRRLYEADQLELLSYEDIFGTSPYVPA